MSDSENNDDVTLQSASAKGAGDGGGSGGSGGPASGGESASAPSSPSKTKGIVAKNMPPQDGDDEDDSEVEAAEEVSVPSLQAGDKIIFRGRDGHVVSVFGDNGENVKIHVRGVVGSRVVQRSEVQRA